MRYLLLTCILLSLSCEEPKKQESKPPTVIPKLEISSDTIVNGGTVNFKAYLTFIPDLILPQDGESFINGFEFRYDSTANFESYEHENSKIATIKSDTAFGEFIVIYPTSDSLPMTFEHTWTASVCVHFKTDTEHTIDTTYIEEFTTTVVR